MKKFLIIIFVICFFLSLLPAVSQGAIAVPKPKARRVLDNAESLPKTPDSKSEEELELLKKYGEEARKNKTPTPSPTATEEKTPEAILSPAPSPEETKAPVEAPKEKSYTCFIVISVLFLILIVLIVSAPIIIKKIVEHRKHNF